MKKKVFIYSVLALAASLTSCNDLLDKEPLDRFINNPVYWSNTSNVDGQINKLYEQFTGYGTGTGTGLFYFKTLSDDQAGGDFTNWTFTNVPTASSDWKTTYEEIRRVNEIIEGVSSSTMTDAQKNNYLGIARLMRAFQYYDIVRKFGDVQWVDRVLDITDEGDLYGKRMDRDAVMDKVLEDLQFATNNINESSSKITFTRQMANAMMADICLYEGTFRKYRTAADNGKAADEVGAKKFLEACVKACEYVMGKGFSLNDSYQGNYNSTDLTGNTEMIFFKPYKKNTLMHSTINYTSSSTQLSGMTKDAFDAYLFTDGKPLATTTLDKNDAGVKNADGNIDITAQLAVRDKRLGETIDNIVFYNGNTWARVAGGMEMTSSTGYGVKKYDNTSLPIADRDQGNKNYTCAPIYWLAVVYLDYAEAKAELGTLTDTDFNNTIKKLYDRAGIENMTLAKLQSMNDPANNMNVSSLLWEIRRCRRCELMFDNWTRYWDLIRWHQLEKLDSRNHPEILQGANIVNDGAATVDKVGNYIDGSKGMTRVYENKHYLYPIPSGQIILNPNLEQNPLWK